MKIDEAKLKKDIKTEFAAELGVQLAGFFGQVTRYFDKRFDRESMATRKQYEKLQNTMDGYLKRQDTDEIERAAMSSQLNRHEPWIGQFADNTSTTLSAR